MLGQSAALFIFQLRSKFKIVLAEVVVYWFRFDNKKKDMAKYIRYRSPTLWQVLIEEYSLDEVKLRQGFEEMHRGKAQWLPSLFFCRG